MTAVQDRTPVPIGPLKFYLPHDPDALYLYRGYAIAGDVDGFNVLYPDRLSEEVDLGWGKDLINAMVIVNELVDR